MHSGRCRMYLYKVCHLTRQIRDLDSLHFTHRYRLLSCRHHREWSLRQDKSAPGFYTLIEETLASSIYHTAIAQRLPDLHKPVTIPAIYPVAPGLAGRIKTHHPRLGMMRTAFPLERGIVLLCSWGSVCFAREHALNFHRWFRCMHLMTLIPIDYGSFLL